MYNVNNCSGYCDVSGTNLSCSHEDHFKALPLILSILTFGVSFILTICTYFHFSSEHKNSEFASVRKTFKKWARVLLVSWIVVVGLQLATLVCFLVIYNVYKNSGATLGPAFFMQVCLTGSTVLHMFLLRCWLPENMRSAWPIWPDYLSIRLGRLYQQKLGGIRRFYTRNIGRPSRRGYQRQPATDDRGGVGLTSLQPPGGTYQPREQLPDDPERLGATLGPSTARSSLGGGNVGPEGSRQSMRSSLRGELSESTTPAGSTHDMPHPTTVPRVYEENPYRETYGLATSIPDRRSLLPGNTADISYEDEFQSPVSTMSTIYGTR